MGWGCGGAGYRVVGGVVFTTNYLMFRLLQSQPAKKFSHHQQPESMLACSISCKNLTSYPIFSPFRARANGVIFKTVSENNNCTGFIVYVASEGTICDYYIFLKIVYMFLFITICEFKSKEHHAKQNPGKNICPVIKFW